MSEVNIISSDIDFLIEQFRNVVNERVFKLPSEYTEEVRYLEKELTPFPGKFSFDRAPFFRDIVDLFSPDNPCRKVVVMKGNQMAATTSLLEPIVLYNIGSNPGPQLLVEPDDDMAKQAMNTKIDRMIDGAGLRGLIYAQAKKAAGSRNTGDTALKKEYPGKKIFLLGHSFGSFVAQSFIEQYSTEINGCILCGTAGPRKALIASGKFELLQEQLETSFKKIRNKKERRLFLLSF
mgnify:CR=1 FL=1